jgi:hypothetical protein
MTMPNRLSLLIVSPTKRKASTPPAPASAAPSAAGRPAEMTAGLAPVGTNGTPSTLAGYAPPASINGLRRNASPVSSGRHTRIGMGSDSAVFTREGRRSFLLLHCSSCITGQTSEAKASYLISAVCEATASHLPLRFTKTSVHT